MDSHIVKLSFGWPVFLPALILFSLLVIHSASTGRVLRTIALTACFSILTGSILIATFGAGFTWSYESYFLKRFAVVVGASVPFISCALAQGLLMIFSKQPVLVFGLGILAGLVAIPVSGYATLIGIVVLTGDGP